MKFLSLKPLLGLFLAILPLLYFLPIQSSPILSLDRDLPELQLSDESGNESLLRDLVVGSDAVVYFGYLNCKTVCSGSLQGIRKLISKNPGTRFIFLSLDPENDDLERFHRIFSESSERAILAKTRNRRESMEAARKFGIISYSDPVHPGEILHSDSLFILGRDARIKGIIPDFGKSWNKNSSDILRSLIELK